MKEELPKRKSRKRNKIQKSFTKKKVGVEMKKFGKRGIAWMLALTMALGESSSALAAEPLQAYETEISQYAETEETAGGEADVTGNDAENPADITGNDAPAKDVSGSDAPASEDTEDKFPGLSDEYTLSAEAYAEKDLLSSHRTEWTKADAGKDYVPGQVLIEAATKEEAEQYAEAFNGTLVSYFGTVALVELNADESLPEASVYDAVQASAAEGTRLPAAWPNYYRYTQSADYSDPYLNIRADNSQWYHEVLNTTQAWNAGYRGQGVKVAILDTGINTAHEELANVITCDISTVDNALGTEDNNGHGTHIAALIGGTLDNGKGGAGIAPECTLYSIKVSREAGRTDSASIISALYKAMEENVDIVNVGFAGTEYSAMEESLYKQAYESGIAVFCPAGNGYSNVCTYPAAYKTTIAVAALDTGMTKAPFSNYDKNVRYSVPGVGIYSAGNEGPSSYVSMSGTSQASAIMAGTAALILPTVKGTGKARVDALLKKMDSSCIKAQGTDLGRGYVNLVKALALTNVNAAPKKPGFSKKAGTYKDNTITLELTGVEVGCTAYYSTDGKTITFKNGVLSDNAKEYTGPIEIGGKNYVQVYAMVIKNSNQLASPVASARYTFRPEVFGVRVESVTGAKYLTQGTGLAFRAVQTPDYGVKQSVKWTLQVKQTNEESGAEEWVANVSKFTGVSVSGSGRISATKKAVPGTYRITATLKNGLSTSMEVEIKAAAQDLTTAIMVKNKNITVWAGQLALVNNITIKKKGMRVAESAAASDINWYSADKSIAVVSSKANGSVYVQGVAFGKTKITGIASDGSGRTVVLNITVKQPVKKLYVTNSKTTETGYTLACNKSIKLNLVVEPANASNKAVKWSVNPAGNGVTVKNGVVKADRKAKPGTYTITAKALDENGAEASFTVEVKNYNKTNIRTQDTRVDLYRINNGYGSSTTRSIQVLSDSADLWNITGNSAPGIVKAEKRGDYVYLEATGRAVGTATVTVGTLDGTNKNIPIRVTVKNPSSSLRISPESGRCAYIACDTSMQMLTTVTNNHGSATKNNQGFYWRTSNAAAVDVDSYGRVTGNSGLEGPVTITAVSADGSNVQATYTVYACDMVKSISIDDDDILTVNVGDTFEKEVKEVAANGGDCSYMIDVKVNKPGLTAEYDRSTHKIKFSGNKEGVYVVTISCLDGSTAKCVYTITVE